MRSIKISTIKPAAYNPRKITKDALENLKGSISDLGFILPIIVNKDNNTIIAGHQRTKAATALGIDEVPCFFIKGCDLHDEIRFNQLHNGVEFEPIKNGYCNLEHEKGFLESVPNKYFEIPEKNAIIVSEISKLILKYGDALCAIICDGRIVFGNNYAYAAKALNLPINCSFIETSKKEIFNHYFAQKYGEFNYDGVKRSDFVQGLAQPGRHASIDWSVLYRRVVPYVKLESKEISILDFGCGKGMFIKRIKTDLSIRKAIGLEFFNHNRKGISIDTGNRMIDNVITHIKQYGLFDYVVCDAVINSVNTQEAEDSVMACLSLFCKTGGKIFFSGRKREAIDGLLNMNQFSGLESKVKFFDQNGLTAILREGQWFFQKFHYAKQVDEICPRFDLEKFTEYTNSGYFGIGATKLKDLPEETYRKAIEYEFNLSLPNGKRFNRHQDILDLFNIK